MNIMIELCLVIKVNIMNIYKYIYLHKFCYIFFATLILLIESFKVNFDYYN